MRKPRKPLSAVEERIKCAWTVRRVTYNPGIGAYETEDWTMFGWQGRYQWPVRRDPIFTPLFTALLGTGGFTIGATTVTYAGLAASIATTALTFGLQLLLAPKPPKPEDGRAPRVQPIPERVWVVGEPRVAGAYMLWEEKDNWLYSVIAIAGHRINGFVKYYLHDDEVVLTQDDDPDFDAGWVDRRGVGGSEHDRYGGNPNTVRIQTRLGLPTETVYADFVSALSIDGVWTSNHRGDGQASLALRCKGTSQDQYPKNYPYGPPQPSVVAQGALVWDFRDDDQDPEDPETWTYSKNSILILAWHHCFSEFGHRRNYLKALVPVIEQWKTEADVCDEDVPLAIGDTEKRYECHGWDTTKNDPKSGTNAILATCDGWLCERGDGALLPVVGKVREQYIGTITDEDIIGARIDDDVPFAEEINKLVPTFVYPATDYTTTDTDFFEDAAAQIEAGRVLSEQADYGWVHSWRQARRLGKRDWLRIREKVRGTLNANLAGMNAVYYRWLRVDAPIQAPEIDGRIIENRKAAISFLEGGFQIDFIVHPENIDTWVPASDEGSAPPVPAKPNDSGVEDTSVDTLLAISNGSSVFLRVAIDEPIGEGLTPVVRWRVKDKESGIPGDQPGAWVEQKYPTWTADMGLVVLDTGAVPTDTVLQVQVAFIATKGTYGDWGPVTPLEVYTTVSAPSLDFSKTFNSQYLALILDD